MLEGFNVLHDMFSYHVRRRDPLIQDENYAVLEKRT